LGVASPRRSQYEPFGSGRFGSVRVLAYTSYSPRTRAAVSEFVSEAEPLYSTPEFGAVVISHETDAGIDPPLIHAENVTDVSVLSDIKVN
jgi:hypothetical protein